jgi:catechol 1,2-dioxygenase
MFCWYFIKIRIDILGFRLVDDFKKAADATATAVLGPFFRHDARILENGASIINGIIQNGEITYMHDTVSDLDTKKPIAGAWIDVWQSSTNGLYEQQDDEQVDCNLRAKFKTDEHGRYNFYCLRPTPSPVPSDGKASTRRIVVILTRS